MQYSSLTPPEMVNTPALGRCERRGTAAFFRLSVTATCNTGVQVLSKCQTDTPTHPEEHVVKGRKGFQSWLISVISLYAGA